MHAANFFLDTNVIIYSIDTVYPKKQAIALELVRKAKVDREGCISMQVVQECLAVMTSPKIQHAMSIGSIHDYLETTLEPLARPLSMPPLYRDALSIQERWKFSFYDALIVAAALALECDTLYSEDFQHKQRIEGLTIINPFV